MATVISREMCCINSGELTTEKPPSCLTANLSRIGRRLWSEDIYDK
jgi:hypothetical protein